MTQPQNAEVVIDADDAPKKKGKAVRNLILVVLAVLVVLAGLSYMSGAEKTNKITGVPDSNAPTGSKSVGPVGEKPSPAMASMMAAADMAEAAELEKKGKSVAPKAEIVFGGEQAPAEEPIADEKKKPIKTVETAATGDDPNVTTGQPRFVPDSKVMDRLNGTAKPQVAVASSPLTWNVLNIAEQAAAVERMRAKSLADATGARAGETQVAATRVAGSGRAGGSQSNEPDLIGAGEDWVAQLVTAHTSKAPQSIAKVEILSPIAWAGATGVAKVSYSNGYLVFEVTSISKAGRTFNVSAYLFDEATNMSAMADEVTNHGLTRAFLRGTLGAVEAAGNLAMKAGTTTNITINSDGSKSETQSSKEATDKDYAIAAIGGGAAEIKAGLNQEIERAFQDEVRTKKNKVVRMIFAEPVKRSAIK